jgi:hypothetical protein
MRCLKGLMVTLALGNVRNIVIALPMTGQSLAEQVYALRALQLISSVQAAHRFHAGAAVIPAIRIRGPPAGLARSRP